MIIIIHSGCIGAGKSNSDLFSGRSNGRGEKTPIISPFLPLFLGPQTIVNGVVSLCHRKKMWSWRYFLQGIVQDLWCEFGFGQNISVYVVKYRKKCNEIKTIFLTKRCSVNGMVWTCAGSCLKVLRGTFSTLETSGSLLETCLEWSIFTLAAGGCRLVLN